MWARLHPACHSRAVWLVHPECVPELYTMAFDPTAASKIPVYLPSGAGATQGPSPTLMGRPVIMTEHCSKLGDEGDIILVDLSQYAVALRSEASLQRSIHESWLSDQVDFRLLLRVTGQPLWASPITLRNGTATVSWCVTLAAR
jgi:HK97 family phage major capsid protein